MCSPATRTGMAKTPRISMGEHGGAVDGPAGVVGVGKVGDEDWGVT